MREGKKVEGQEDGAVSQSEDGGRTYELNFALALAKTLIKLYEAAKNVIVSGIMWRLTLLKNLPPGFLFWSLLVAHSTLRFLVEFFKDYQTSFEPILGVFTMGQVISLIVVIGAGIMLWKTWKSGKQGKTIKQE